MKKIFVLAVVLLSVFLIYLTTLDKKVYYLALGDSLALGMTPYNNYDYGYTDYIKDYLSQKKVLEKYINNFAKSSYRTTDLIRAINDNEKVLIDGKKVTIKHALIKADLVTISVGMNDFINKNSLLSLLEENDITIFKYVDEIMVDVEELFKIIRKYCKEDVVMVGYYSPIADNEKVNKFFSYVNSKYDYLSSKYNIKYVDIYNQFKNSNDYLIDNYNVYPNKKGYKKIADVIIGILDESLFK
ncbi:MAG: GDSL-type esterase/lipase family protein [Bacilli bacterium]